MKISDLIKDLQHVQGNYGDVDIRMVSTDVEVEEDGMAVFVDPMLVATVGEDGRTIEHILIVEPESVEHIVMPGQYQN